MKQMGKVLAFFWVVILSAGNGVAQQGYTALSYNTTFAVGNTADFINRPGWQGVGLEAGTFLKPTFSLGIVSSWNILYKAVGESTVTTENDVTLSGKQYRFLNAIPLFVTGRYYFRGLTPTRVFLFAGLGMGTMYVRRQTDMGFLALKDQTWQFALYPEAGLNYTIQSGVGLFAVLRYHQGFGNTRLPATSYAGVNIGIAYSLF